LGSKIKIDATIKTGSCLGLKSTISIELENSKSISLHQEFTPILAPRPNVGTNIIDQFTLRDTKTTYTIVCGHIIFQNIHKIH
jgi:hypothetical protein